MRRRGCFFFSSIMRSPNGAVHNWEHFLTAIVQGNTQAQPHSVLVFKMPSKGDAQIPPATRQIASALHPTRHYRHVGIKIAQRFMMVETGVAGGLITVSKKGRSTRAGLR